MTNERRLQLNKERLSNPKISPLLREKVLKVIADLEAENIKPLITDGFRSNYEQNQLFALGRTKRGKIVTNARGGQSNHNFGRAVDMAFVDESGAVVWDLKLYKRLGVIAKLYGLKWGGDWRKHKDNPHLEL